jgi:hypothetical protein
MKFAEYFSLVTESIRGKFVFLTKKDLNKLPNGVSIDENGLYNSNFGVRVHESLIKNDELIVKFGRIGGDFNASNLFLRSMKGFPHTIDGNLIANNNVFGQLEHFPQTVNGGINLRQCSIDTMEGLPKVVFGDLDMSVNNVTSFNGGVLEVRGSLRMMDNKLVSLKGIPKVHKNIDLSKNKLSSLIGLPKIVNGNLVIGGMELTTLKGCSEVVNGMFAIEGLDNLDSLEYAPSFVKGDFVCNKFFSEEDVLAVTKVGGSIRNDY